MNEYSKNRKKKSKKYYKDLIKTISNIMLSLYFDSKMKNNKLLSNRKWRKTQSQSDKIRKCSNK